MTFWIKTEDEKAIKLVDENWRAKIYASGKACDDADYVFSKIKDHANAVRVVNKREIEENRKHPVLEIELKKASGAKRLAGLLESKFQDHSKFRLYNVDVLPEQSYFYENDLFPLAKVLIDVDGISVKRWEVDDSVERFEYEIPPLRLMSLSVKIADKVPKIGSKLEKVEITTSTLRGEPSFEETGFEGGEREMLERIACKVKRFDPDFVITQNGDSFVVPYLRSKARAYCVDLGFDRDKARAESLSGTGGTTYFSYGRVMFRPNTQRFYGRIHLDEENTFIYDQCRLDGLFEVSRLCRMPLHTSARSSIGKCLSSLQFYHATRSNILIPWKPSVAEDFKNGYDLIVGDRGGLVLSPLEGVHERVCEIDFSSLYPSIIRKWNISAETVNCDCCRNSEKIIVEELGLKICTKNEGVVAESLKLPLAKRFEYKRLMQKHRGTQIWKKYNERAAALKWILVCCFGYLSYRNAKFGKIDSHMAVCSIARRTLQEAIHTANNRGFKVVHGIIDSLWLYKRRVAISDYEELQREIEANTGFRLSIEGIYKWIVFLSSKVNVSTQVANRYFGCFEGTNELKVRGIEYRRHDTPAYFKKCQGEILKVLARCDTVAELKECARSKGMRIFEEHARMLEEHKVQAHELLIRRRLSKDPESYSSKRQLSVAAANQLEREGMKLKAGQPVSYVITNYSSGGENRGVPNELIEEKSTEYDSERYIDLLAECCATVLEPFGVSKEMLLARSASLLQW